MRRKKNELVDSCYIEGIKLYKLPINLEVEEEYNEQEFDKLEKDVLEILKEMEKDLSTLCKIFYFKIYYGIDEHRYSKPLNYRQISEKFRSDGRKMSSVTIMKWVNIIMNQVKTELIKKGYKL